MKTKQMLLFTLIGALAICAALISGCHAERHVLKASDSIATATLDASAAKSDSITAISVRHIAGTLTLDSPTIVVGQPEGSGSGGGRTVTITARKARMAVGAVSEDSAVRATSVRATVASTDSVVASVSEDVTAGASTSTFGLPAFLIVAVAAGVTVAIFLKKL